MILAIGQLSRRNRATEVQIIGSRWVKSLALMSLVATTSSCGLPRSGPNKHEIFAGSAERKGDAFIVAVDSKIARVASQDQQIGFPPSFVGAGVLGSDQVHPGDILGVTIWENVDQGLMTKGNLPATPLKEVQVDGEGYIFVPYAGRIKASGLSADQLRQEITAKLAPQTPDPQVEVTRMAGDGSTVSVLGDIRGQGVYPIERPTRTLSAMIAKAGGVAVEPDAAMVTVTRGNQTGRARLQDIYQNPAMDIALRSGDIVLVQADPRAFTAMGATGAQTQVKFVTARMTAIEALAQVGGLQTNLADPTGVFVLREERPDIANAVLGRHDLTTPQRVAYVLNLTEPEGLFNARDFLIRDGDTIYVTEAPYVQWQKTLSVLTGTAASASTIDRAALGQ